MSKGDARTHVYNIRCALKIQPYLPWYRDLHSRIYILEDSDIIVAASGVCYRLPATGLLDNLAANAKAAGGTVE